jgi:WhiB family redox-sensing transcriptional regulator
VTAVAPQVVWSWEDLAACRGNPGPFFGPDNESELARERRERKAKRICQGCQVKNQCRALIEDKPSKHGIWAGENHTDRSNRRRRERRQLAEVS